jgi:tRNA pseudouridine55 synthase
MDGIILVNKERDYTSFDVVAIMRKLLNTKKVGHLGTLDPMATGVLPILIGKGTKLGQYLKADKEYIATFKFGLISDTQDIWGDVEEVAEENPADDDLVKVLKSFIGKYEQMPPMYSAKKVNGVKLYKLARQGVEIERKPKEIEIFNLQYLGKSNDEYKIKVACSEGTYIRTLIKDIGERLQKHALMTSLIRTKSHGFSLDDSYTLAEIKEKSEAGEIPLISLESALNDYKKIEINNSDKPKFLNGVKLTVDDNLDCTYYRVYSDDEFLGLGQIRETDNKLKVTLHAKGSE